MKRPLTLIELLLSLALFALLIQSLFFWYRSLSETQSKMGNKRWEVLEKRYSSQQLQKIFSHVQPDSYFFTTGPESTTDGDTLVFVFDNGLQSNPHFADKVLARLFIDKEEQTLCLGIWPHPDRGVSSPGKTVVLLENVQGLSFEFYFPPNPFKKTVEPKEVGKALPQERWQSEWLSNYNTLPPLMKVHFHRSGEKRPLTYAFDFVHSPHHIVYKKDSA